MLRCCFPDQIHGRLCLAGQVRGFAMPVHGDVEDSRALKKEVIVNSRNLETIVEKGRHHRVYFVLQQDQVPHHHVFAAGSFRHRQPSSKAERRRSGDPVYGDFNIVAWNIDFKESVLKINIPRNDVKVTIDGISTPTPFGFGGWLAMTKGTGGEDVMMGDLVLLEDEVNPVMSALLNNGIEVTALHNHFFFESPRIFYMHAHGHGKAAELASKAKPALDLIGKGTAQHQSSSSAGASTVSAGKLDTANLAKIAGHDGEQTGDVYKITVGRDDLNLMEMGAKINSRMG